MINTYLPSKLAEMESDILIHNMEMEMNATCSAEAFNINDFQLEALLEWKLAICN
jgi:hypothetical protein